MRELEKYAPFVIIPLVLYTLYVTPLGVAMMTIGFAAILFALTKSKLVFLAVLLLAPFVAPLMRRTVEPVGMEGFQARDPINVQTRLEAVKTSAPLHPKQELPADYNILNSSAKHVDVVTGVLESPDILDNTPLMEIEQIGKDGLPGVTIPASAKARVLIYPPAEDSVPAPRESIKHDPMSNPYLQTGQDRLAEEVSLAQKGTELYAQDSASLDGVASGAGPAF
ncbi:MAG: hypothetical protein EB127_07460 [Alphaproteobacteria bacterium]|jgi:hypothetical protein|nr:hypothetical protein [Alphaproteobacteria bacterium]